MREILFRGKTFEGKWIEGFLFQECGDCMVNWCISRNPLCANDYSEILGDYAEVIPETVGQYTGLTDKNGKKIFEGDILSFSDRLVYVNWHDYCGCWDCSYIKAVKGKATLHEDRSPNKWRYNAVVIGNIHDNPELLKGSAEE